MKRIYDFLLTVNTYFLVLAAIFTVIESPWGSPLFVYTSCISLIDSIKIKNTNGIVVNCTFGAMNTYFLTGNIIYGLYF